MYRSPDARPQLTLGRPQLLAGALRGEQACLDALRAKLIVLVIKQPRHFDLSNPKTDTLLTGDRQERSRVALDLVAEIKKEPTVEEEVQKMRQKWNTLDSVIANPEPEIREATAQMKSDADAVVSRLKAMSLDNPKDVKKSSEKYIKIGEIERAFFKEQLEEATQKLAETHVAVERLARFAQGFTQAMMGSSQEAVTTASELRAQRELLDRLTAATDYFKTSVDVSEATLEVHRGWIAQAEKALSKAPAQRTIAQDPAFPIPQPRAKRQKLGAATKQSSKAARKQWSNADQIKLHGLPELLAPAAKDLAFLRKTWAWTNDLAVIAALMKQAGGEALEQFFFALQTNTCFPWKIPASKDPFAARPMATGFRKPMGLAAAAKDKAPDLEQPEAEEEVPDVDPRGAQKKLEKEQPFPKILPATDDLATQRTLEIAKWALDQFAPELAEKITRDIEKTLAAQLQPQQQPQTQTQQQTPLASLMHGRVDKLWIQAAHGHKATLTIRSLEDFSDVFQKFTWRLTGVALADGVHTGTYRILIKRVIHDMLSEAEIAALSEVAK